MEVTHILLGSPWKFDKQTLRDGQTNQYIFFINANKTTLLPLSPQEVNKDRNKVRKDKDGKEKGKAFTMELLASKKSFSNKDMHYHSSFSSKAKMEDSMRVQKRKSGFENKDGISKARGRIIKDGESSHEKLLYQLKSSSINKDIKNLRLISLQEKEDDEGLIPTNDDGPWHMLRRKGVH